PLSSPTLRSSVPLRYHLPRMLPQQRRWAPDARRRGGELERDPDEAELADGRVGDGLDHPARFDLFALEYLRHGPYGSDGHVRGGDPADPFARGRGAEVFGEDRDQCLPVRYPVRVRTEARVVRQLGAVDGGAEPPPL